MASIQQVTVPSSGPAPAPPHSVQSLTDIPVNFHYAGYFVPSSFIAQTQMVNAVAMGKARWVSRYYGANLVGSTAGEAFGIETTVEFFDNPPANPQDALTGTRMTTSPNLDVSFDAWGSTIPLMMGHERLAGHITFAQGLEIGTSAAALSFIDLEVSFGYPLDPLEWQWIECVALWANGNKIFGGENDLEGLSFTFYEGKEDAPVAPEVLADKGAARATGMRGMRRIVLNQFPIGLFGNSLPTFNAEFAMTKDAPAPLISVADVLKKIHARGNVTLTTESNFDDEAAGVAFMGDVAPVALARDLMPTYNYFIKDGDGASLSRRAVDDDLVIDGDPLEVDDLIVESSDDPPITFERAEPSEIARLISTQYTDIDLAFTNGIQYAPRPNFPIRQVLSDRRGGIQLPFAIDSVTALTLGFGQLYRGWTESLKLKFKSSDLRIEVGDVKQINGGDLGTYIVRVAKSNLRFDKSVVNEIESVALLKRTGVDVNADSGDYLTETTIKALKYPDIIYKPSSSTYPYMGQPIIIGSALATTATIFSPSAIYGTAFASTQIPARIPRRAFVPLDDASQDGVISAGPRLQDASYIYTIDFARSGIQRILKSDTQQTEYLDLTGSTAALSPNGNQFVISDGYLYWSERPTGSVGTRLHAYRLDLSLFSVGGLTTLALDSDTGSFNQIGAVVITDTLLLSTFSRSAAAARLYSIDLTDPTFSTFDYVSLVNEPAAGQGYLGRGLAVDGIGYFLPIEAHDAAKNWDDESANKAAQVWGAKVGAITVGSVPSTFDAGATLLNTSLTGGDLIADHDNTSLGGARNTLYKTSGKYYFEMTLDVVTTGVSGVCVLPSDQDYSTTHFGGAMYAPTGVIWASGGFSGSSLGIVNSGDVIGCAADLDNGLVWFINVTQAGDWNGDAGADPATGTGGIDMNSVTTASRAPAVAFGDTGSDGSEKATANFGATAFSGTAPSGFTDEWVGTSITGGIDWFDLTDDADVSFGSKGNMFPWTDGVNLYFLANCNHQSPFDQFLAARKLSDLSVVTGFDLSSLYDDTKFDFYQGATDGSFHYIIGTNYDDISGAILKIEQDLSAGELFYRGVRGAPDNDDFADGAPLSINTTVTADNILATKQAGEPDHNGNAGGASIWYFWTAPNTDPVSIDAGATSPIFVNIGVYTGSAVDALTPVTSGTSLSPAAWTPTAGVRYRIAFDGNNGATGTIKFTFSD